MNPTDIAVRDARIDDAAEIARLRLVPSPYLIVNTETVAHQLRSTPAERRASRLVAESAGEIVGFAAILLDPEEGEGFARCEVIVADAWTRRGIGTRLYRALLAHATAIGARTVQARAVNAAGAAFGESQGFRTGRVELVSHLSLQTLPESPLPQGYRMVPLSLLPDSRALHELDCALLVDVPGDGTWDPLSYEEWRWLYVADGKLRRDCTVLAFAGDEAVGVAWLDATDHRVWSGLTGVLPKHRRRGLATALKVESLRLARAAGFTDAYTSNDSGNVAMLAVNERLGYRPVSRQPSLVLQLT